MFEGMQILLEGLRSGTIDEKSVSKRRMKLLKRFVENQEDDEREAGWNQCRSQKFVTDEVLDMIGG